jgi:hypothetical protein
MEDHSECMLVLIGATPEGKKELIGFQVGVRESAQSWRELLIDVTRRGLKITPEIAVGDGALGFWKALDEVFPGTRHQRCWVHKTAMAGHLLAMLLVLLPFAVLVALVEWQRQIQIGASLLVIGFGVFRLVDRRHPRALARIRPTQLGLWSFAVAIAHGAGLMLVPIYLGLCRQADLDKGHEAAGTLMNANLGMAVLVSVVHATAMIAAGGCSAWLVYRYLGLKFVSRSWFNLDTAWAVSLILVGAIALLLSLTD